MTAPVTTISTTVEGFEITFTSHDGITDADVRRLGEVVSLVRGLHIAWAEARGRIGKPR